MPAASGFERRAQNRNEISLIGNIRIGMDRNFKFTVTGPRNVVTEQLRARLDHFNAMPAHEKGRQLTSGLLQYGPYAMFILLPVFAWLQQISYAGRLRPYPGGPSATSSTWSTRRTCTASCSWRRSSRY